ncbi:MAG: DUF4376 domain-containing protein [Giesbergeria sp.]
MTTIYTYDSQGIYSGAVECDPLKAVPPGLLVAPPALTGTQVAQVQGGAWVVLPEYPAAPVVPLLQRQTAAWERIKNERDRRKVLGVKVGDHWYHSDDSSRIQQLSLFVMGAAVPPVQWKTLTLSPPPVFVTMTQAIAAGIFQNTAASDGAVFAAAEVHRVAMEASSTPEGYDISSGWPASIEDEQ